MRFTRSIIGAIVVGVAAHFSWITPSHAQSLPSGCVPSGSTYECLAVMASPWEYTHNTCGTHEIRANEAESFQDELNEWSSYCGLETLRVGWLTTPQSVWLCGITSTLPNYNWGIEVDNISRYTFWHWQTCSNQTIVETTNNAVIRSRTPLCPQGYALYTSSGVSRCRREVAKLEPQKGLGAPCPPCGNPIHPGFGNKYQEDTDYEGSGPNPLLIRRYYNSAMEWNNNRTFYSAGDAWDGSWLGYAAFGKLAMHPEDLRFHLMAPDAIGGQWRHHYQRAVFVNTTTGITSALAYRHDGRVVTFNLYQGGFVPQVDINDRLIQLPDGRFEYRAANDHSTETYSAEGYLESIRSRAGTTHSVAYDSCKRIASVTDDFGRALQFQYEHACSSSSRVYRITGITVPDGTSISYSYNAPTGTLVGVGYPGGATRAYTYAGWNGRQLTGSIDENGATFASWTYDSSGRAITSQHANGADAVTVTYTKACTFCPEWQIVRGDVTDALGSVTKYFYGVVRGTNRITKIERPHPSGTGIMDELWTYDTNGNVASRQDYRDIKTTYIYDLSRNLETSRTEGLNSNGSSNPESRTITTQWHPTLRLPTLITEPGRTTAYTYNGNGDQLTTTITDTATSASRTWTRTYDAFGRILTDDGPRTDISDVTTYTYYNCSTGIECGQLHTITNAVGQVTTLLTYNAHGQPLTVLDPNAGLTALAYDARQQLTSRTVGGEATNYVYWPTGLLKRVTAPDSSFLEYMYDTAHRLTQITDNEGNHIAYTLDAMGNRIHEQVFDPSSSLARTHYRTVDSLNRLKTETGSANVPAVATTFTHDNNGNLTKVEAPLGRTTTQTYDKLDRLKQITNPSTGITVHGYNARDELTSVTDPRSLVTQYGRNGFGDITQLTSPDTGITTNTYDSGGNLKTMLDASGETATYTYDALGRLSSVVYDDQTIANSYDAGSNGIGRLTGVTDNSGSTAWTYTVHGRVATRTQIVAALTRQVAYGYDSAGRLSTITYPSGVVVTYGYTAGKLTSVTSGSETFLSNVLYDPFGPVRGWTWGNSTQMVRTYDLDGNIDQLDSSGLKTYTQDDAFRITGITDPADSTKNWTYGYDLIDRLTAANKTGLSQGWTYDANGNRLSQTGTAPSSYTIAGTNNRLNGVTGSLSRSYSYDASGNATADGVATFGYDGAGRMVSATKSGTTTTYSLNALGQRVRKTTAGVSTIFVYGEAGQLLGEYASNGDLIREYVWFGDIPISVITAGPGTPPYFYWYIHADHLNTPRYVERSLTGQLVWRWDSTPFGEAAPDEDPDGDSTLFALPLRFPGQYWDAETGLHHNGFRDYDPATGRYPASDPIGLDGGFNTYAYVAGNPLSFVDPNGLEKVILLPPNDPGYQAALNTPDDPDVCRVISHGSSSSVRRMNALQLHRYLNAKGRCKPKQPVVLEACNTGRGDNSIAEQLAKLRKTLVTAPDNRVWTTPWNSTIDTPMPPVSENKASDWNAVPNWLRPGSWRDFSPSGPITGQIPQS